MPRQRQLAIGDIHGCIKTFRKMLFDILHISQEDEIYLLGDYIDRGHESKKVVDLIMKLTDAGYKIFPVRGNHEEMILETIEYGELNWYKSGALITLQSFDITDVKHIDKLYFDFFKSLKYYYKTDDYIFTHAGLNCHADNPFEDNHSMLWPKDDFVDLKKTGNRKVICGHSPHSLDEIKASLKTDYIFLDGGCVHLNTHPNQGHLCALDIETLELYSQINIDNLA